MTEESANRFVLNARGQWSNLVRVARATPPRARQDVARTLADAAGVGKSTLARKLEALHMAMNSGMSDEELIRRGQRWVMERFVKEKRNGRTDAQVCLKWMVAPELRDAAIANSVRVAKVLRFTTSNEYWQWLNSQIELATDEELRHSAGLINVEKRG